MIGKILGNRYEIVEKIGGGGMALVYKARCKLLNRYVAIKILRSEFINDEEFINKFRRESQAAASLSHPNIVGIYDVGVEDNIYYIVMEYVNGKTLKQYIREQGKLSIEESLDIAIKIAEALSHAHKNHIVHRDIKPHNILVTEDGRAKVTDFGIARAATASTVTNTSNVIGSVHYFSPEQARGGYTDEKSDIYSLGVVMYEMVTGRVPFQGDSPISVALKHIQEDIEPPSHFDDSIPKNLESIIMKCVQKDQSLRYSNIELLLNDLKKVRDSEDFHIEETHIYNDSPTRIIPRIDDEIVYSTVNENKNNKKINKNSDYETEPDKKTTSRVITLAAIMLAFLLTISFAIGFFWIRDKIKGEEIVVPSIVGLHRDVAEEQIRERGLDFKVKNEVFSSDFKAGHVIEQSIDGGNTVKAGFPIEVTISKGEQEVDVPNVVNKHIDDAETILENHEFKSSVKYIPSDIPKDYVISQTPDGDSKLPIWSTVSLVVSEGPEIKYVVMPNVIGDNVENAKKDLTDLGLLVEISEEENENVDKGIVIWQSFTANSEVAENTTVNLTVSKGIETENNSNTDEDTGVVEEDLVYNNLSIILPKDKSEVEVKIYRIQDNERELIYNKIHITSEESISVPVEGKKNAKYEVYIDGIFKGEI